MSSDVGARSEERPLGVSAVTARPEVSSSTGASNDLIRVASSPSTRTARSRGEGGANLLRPPRKFSQHTPERFARDAHHDRVLDRTGADAACGRSVERAFANEGAGADPSLALRLRSILEQCDRARMHEIPRIGRLAREEERLARPQAPLFTRKGDELHRLARKQVEGSRPPRAVRRRRRASRRCVPWKPRLATSL